MDTKDCAPELAYPRLANCRISIAKAYSQCHDTVGIVAMIFIGGITRLTGSGLSMVEWRPFLGFLPPLTETEWTRVFELYKLSPEFKQINSWMDISDFKFIFFWEYFHRVWGRLIGLFILIPFLYFIFTKNTIK